MRKIYIILSFLLFATIASSQTPVLYLKYNEANGAKTVLDQVSGTSFSVAGLAERNGGLEGNSLRTDGTTTYASGSFNYNFGSSMTIETWVDMENYPADEERITDVNALHPTSIISQFNNTQGWAIQVNAFGNWFFSATINGAKYKCSPSTLFPIYKWVHVAAVINGATGNMYLYLNGNQVAQTTIPANGTITKTSSDPLIVGKSNIDYKPNSDQRLYNGFNGAIDETKIFNTALTPAQIQAEYNLFSSSLPDPMGINGIQVPSTRFANDLQRPTFHAMPPANWTNEPHGMVNYNGQIHMFYQRTPNAPVKSLMHWGHMTSTDAVNWTNTKDALMPGWNEVDGVGIWSGDVVVNNGTAYAFYTSVNTIGSFNPGIALATSNDANFETWTKLGGKIDKPADVADMRDPFIWKIGSKWYMIIGAAIGSNGGLAYFSSTDLVNWTRMPVPFSTVAFSTMDIGSAIWEMPVFQSLGNGKYVLEVNPIGGSVSKYGSPNATRSVYWTGTFVNEQFVPDYNKPKNLDLVYGHLSPTVSTDANGVISAIGMIDERINTQFQNDLGWNNVFSLPRNWYLMNDGKTLGQKPSSNIDATRIPSSHQTFSNLMVNGTSALSSTGKATEVLINIDPNNTGSQYGLNLRISPDRSEITKIYYDTNTKQIYVDKTKSSSSTQNETGNLALLSGSYDEVAFGKPKKMQIYIDNSVIEVFINDAAVFSTRVYPLQANATGLELFSNGTTSFTSVDVWQMQLKQIPVTGITLPSTTSVAKGANTTLTPTFIPSNATNRNVTWSSNNTSVATVNASGLVTGVAQGSSTITVTTQDGGFKATCVVTVTPPVLATSISLDKTSLSMSTGSSVNLLATIAPANTSNPTVKWSSSNLSIATVDSTGVVTAIAQGSANITATTADGSNLSTSCSVSITNPLVYDFETQHDLTGWTTTGNAFTNAGVTTTASGWWGAFNQQGTWHYWGYNVAHNDSAMGTMQTAPFTLGGNGIITFLLAGGNDINNLYIAVCKASDNSVLMKMTANNSEAYPTTAQQFDASAYLGQSLYIKLVDNTAAGFGHLNFDNLRIPISGVTIPVTGVALSTASISLTSGNTSQLAASITPSNATNQNLTWTSNNTGIATVSSSGLVTAVSQGNATITVTTQDGAKTATCLVAVTTSTVSVISVSLNTASALIPQGGTSQLAATINPTNATNKNVIWSSSNPAIATVSSNGLVTAVAQGTATITVTTQDGNKTATCVVTVTIPVTGVSLNTSSVSINAGNTSQLIASITPSNATNQNISWTSSNASIATVNSAGLVTAVAAGTATITVTTQDGNKTATCVVTVTSSSSFLVYDFETNHDLTGWTTTGSAFTNAGVTNITSGWWGAFNQQGLWHFWGFNSGGDATTGTMQTSTFILGGNGIIRFLLGGGNDINNLFIAVCKASDNSVLMKMTASNNEAYTQQQFDASAYLGQSLYVKLVDNTSAGFGHLNLDNLIIPTGPGIPVTGVSLNKSTSSITQGGTDQLTSTVLPSNASNPAVTWSSSNTNVATVSSNGLISAISAGTATITVTTLDGSKTATCTVTVTPVQFLVYDFETNHNLTGWTTTGTAFTNAGVTNTTSGWWGAFNQQGAWHFWGFNSGGDATTGTMQTRTFTLAGNGVITFLLGGGNDINNLYIAVCRASDNTVLMKMTASNNEAYTAQLFNASAYLGQDLYVKVVDNSSAGFGHLNIDNLIIPYSALKSSLVSTVSSAKEENGHLSVQVYPNPSNGSPIQINITGFEPNADLTLNLYGMNGQLKSSTGIATDNQGNGYHSLDTNGLDPQLYLLVVKSDKLIAKEKIVICK